MDGKLFMISRMQARCVPCQIGHAMLGTTRMGLFIFICSCSRMDIWLKLFDLSNTITYICFCWCSAAAVTASQPMAVSNWREMGSSGKNNAMVLHCYRLFSYYPKVNVLGFLNCSTQVISETTWLLAVARLQACSHMHACNIIYSWILLMSTDPKSPYQLWASHIGRCWR